MMEQPCFYGLPRLSSTFLRHKHSGFEICCDTSLSIFYIFNHYHSLYFQLFLPVITEDLTSFYCAKIVFFLYFPAVIFFIVFFVYLRSTGFCIFYVILISPYILGYTLYFERK